MGGTLPQLSLSLDLDPRALEARRRALAPLKAAFMRDQVAAGGGLLAAAGDAVYQARPPEQKDYVLYRLCII